MKDEALQIISARNVLFSFSVSISSRDFFFVTKTWGDDCTHHPHLKSRVDASPHPPAIYAGLFHSIGIPIRIFKGPLTSSYFLGKGVRFGSLFQEDFPDKPGKMGVFCKFNNNHEILKIGGILDSVSFPEILESGYEERALLQVPPDFRECRKGS